MQIDDTALSSQIITEVRYNFPAHGLGALQGQDKKELVHIVKHALYASKIISYAQGLNIIKKKSEEKGWNVDLGEISRIWKVQPPFQICHLLEDRIPDVRVSKDLPLPADIVLSALRVSALYTLLLPLSIS